MLKKKRWLGLLIGLVILLYSPMTFSATEIHQNAGSRAMTFLKIGIGAKAIGMGESQVAEANDLYASYWNPAGLAKILRPQFGLMHNEWFAGINHEFLGFAQPIGRAGVIGGSVIYMSFGEIVGRDANGKETSAFRPYDLALILSYARRMGSNLAIGANAKWVREAIDTESAQALAFDMGGLYSFSDRPLSFGFNLQHLGTQAAYVQESFSLPFNIKVGGAYKLLKDNFTIVADLNRPSDNNITAAFGAALAVSDAFQLRTGYKYRIGGNDLGAASGVTGGVGFGIEGFQIDYAFVSFGRLGPTHRFSLITDF